ncbi:molybdopterin-guanine dinucleotide biosynthesis protein A [Dethiosulfatibacter aminovorans DSM 17477]|uniref:Probable molybdenum cofactor guanylyltransferase n=1 Tax=Dethiosulfatibacter aminovorans DSM 17477 TaxID=1121476 RepID=A0A1M6K0K4_9FIRM|nr:molybdenum cofactor guanylyltransferase [Dethiosulfatibacter aminovorans]SHJ52428.1 molybdopterin-guanine dinucleotide biosynthesis protein A [Dethiosulfatibacter aminovorans DSM 17477]
MERFNSAIILAGGKSSRMGYNKELIMIDEKRIVNYQIEALHGIFDEIIVVTKNREFYNDLDCRAVSDIIEDKGPFGGIHAGLVASRSKYSYVMACDMPVINTAYINFMKKNIYQKDVDGCMTLYGDHIEPFNAFYSKNIVMDIEEYLYGGGYSIHKLVKTLKFIYIEENKARRFSPNWEMFINFNTREDISIYLGSGSSD